MNLRRFTEWFGRKGEPDFTAAFASDLRQRFGVSSFRFRLPRVRCAWHLIEHGSHQGVTWARFELDGHAAQIQRLVTAFFRHGQIYPRDGDVLVIDSATKIVSLVHSSDDGHTIVTLRQRRDENAA